jgi:hypothetical protein
MTLYENIFSSAFMKAETSLTYFFALGLDEKYPVQ